MIRGRLSCELAVNRGDYDGGTITVALLPWSSPPSPCPEPQAALVILRETIAAEDAHRAERDARKGGMDAATAERSGGFH